MILAVDAMIKFDLVLEAVLILRKLFKTWLMRLLRMEKLSQNYTRWRSLREKHPLVVIKLFSDEEDGGTAKALVVWEVSLSAPLHSQFCYNLGSIASNLIQVKALVTEHE